MSGAPPPVPADALTAVARLVEARSGLRFVGGRRSELSIKIGRAFEESGCQTWDAYLAALSRSPGGLMSEQLIESLTVGETYFFRHRPYFDLLERDVLPRLIGERHQTRQLRLWSAGCATGEEAYSLAILIWRLLPDLADWDVSILGTDLNDAFLTQAREGLFREWSFRGADERFRTAYFRPEGQRFRIQPEIARLVRFARLNLAEPVYPSPATATTRVDLVLCRNVLMYFALGLAHEVVARLRMSLAPDGWLVVGPSDALPGLFPGFEAHGGPDAIVYRRVDDEGHRTPVRPGFPLASPARPADADRTVAWRAARDTDAQGHVEAAEASCRRILEQGAPPAERYYRLGTLHQASGDEGAALMAFRKSLYSDGTFIPSLLGVAAVYRQSGQHDRAHRALARAQRLLVGRSDDELILAEAALTVGRLRDVLARALGNRQGAPDR